MPDPTTTSNVSNNNNSSTTTKNNSNSGGHDPCKDSCGSTASSSTTASKSLSCYHGAEKENQQATKWVWDELENEKEEGGGDDLWDTSSKGASTTTTEEGKDERAMLLELNALHQDVMTKIRAMKAELKARDDETQELEATLHRRRAAYQRARKDAEQVR